MADFNKPEASTVITSSDDLPRSPSWHLHDEIVNFYNAIHADGKELAKRQAIVQNITNLISPLKKPALPVKYFGSTYTGLFLTTDDIDITVVTDYWGEEMTRFDDTLFKRVHWLRKIGDQLVTSKQFKIVKLSEAAPVPLLKVVDVNTGTNVDITCSSAEQRSKRCRWILETLPRYPNLPKLLTVLKELLRARSFAEGGISSYCLLLLTVSFLQHQSNVKDNLGELLPKFLVWFYNDVDHIRNAVVHTGQLVAKADMRTRFKNRPRMLCVQDPVDPDNDVGAYCYESINFMKQVCRRATRVLKEHLKPDEELVGGKSVLKLIFVGNEPV